MAIDGFGHVVEKTFDRVWRTLHSGGRRMTPRPTPSRLTCISLGVVG